MWTRAFSLQVVKVELWLVTLCSKHYILSGSEERQYIHVWVCFTAVIKRNGSPIKGELGFFTTKQQRVLAARCYRPPPHASVFSCNNSQSVSLFCHSVFLACIRRSVCGSVPRFYLPSHKLLSSSLPLLFCSLFPLSVTVTPTYSHLSPFLILTLFVSSFKIFSKRLFDFQPLSPEPFPPTLPPSPFLRHLVLRCRWGTVDGSLKSQGPSGGCVRVRSCASVNFFSSLLTGTFGFAFDLGNILCLRACYMFLLYTFSKFLKNMWSSEPKTSIFIFVIVSVINWG